MIHILLNNTLVADATYTGDTIQTKRAYDESGVYQLTISAGAATAFKVQGRVTADMSWHDIVSETGSPLATTMSDTITIYPEMRALVTSSGGGTTNTFIVALME